MAPQKIKISSKYFRAANLIEEKREMFCCNALTSVGLSLIYFTKYFYPDPSELNKKNEEDRYWWFGSFWIDENQLARQIALNLMYEMHRRSGKKTPRKYIVLNPKGEKFSIVKGRNRREVARRFKIRLSRVQLATKKVA